MPDKKIDAIAYEVAERVIAELERIRMITEGRDSTFTQALREAIPRVRVKLTRWCEQVTNQHPKIEMDTTLQSPTTPLTVDQTQKEAVVTIAYSHGDHTSSIEWSGEEVMNLFVYGKEYNLKMAADFAIPVATLPLVNKLFNLMLAGAGKYIKPVGQYNSDNIGHVKDVFDSVLAIVKEKYGIDEPLIPAGESLL